MIKSQRMVRKRDGREVPFDQTKIVDAIYKAACSVGQGDRYLAEELGSVVALFIEREWTDRTPSIDDVSDLIEKVLAETGHAPTAKAFILERERRARIRAALRVRRDDRGGGESGLPTVDARTHATVSPWSKTKIVEALVVEADLPAEVAEEIAAEVERRVFASGMTRISTTAIRALVDNELFERGYDKPLDRQTIIGLPRYDLDRLARAGTLSESRPPASASCVDREVARSAWTHYSLLEVYPQDVVEAHLAGQIHVGGLAAPNRFLAIAADSGAALAAAKVPASEIIERVALFAARCRDLVADSVELGGVARLLAGHLAARDADPDVLARRLLLALGQPLEFGPAVPRLELCLQLAPPPALVEAAAAAGRPAGDAEALHREFLAALLKALSQLRAELAAPRFVLDVAGATAADEPLLDLVAVAEGDADAVALIVQPPISGSLARFSPVLSRVAINLAQAAFRAPRFDAAAVIANAVAAVHLATEACDARARYLGQLPPAAAPKDRLRRLAGADAANASGGRHEIRLAGLEAACRIAFDHEPLAEARARTFAIDLIEALRAAVAREALARRLPLAAALAADGEAIGRFGSIDFERHARGRDVHGLPHDGRRYLYGAGLGLSASDPDPAAAADLEAALRRDLVPTALPPCHQLARDRVRFLRRSADSVRRNAACS